MIYGAQEVLKITPAATLFAFMVGVTLGLPAGYFGGKLDTFDHLHRQPRAGLPGDPAVLPAGDARNRRRGRAAIHVDGAVHLPHPVLRGAVQLALPHAGAETEPAGGASRWSWGCGLFLADLERRRSGPAAGLFRLWPEALDLFDIQGNLLIVFVSVVFVNSPTVFRIVRGIVLDIKTRDYVAAGQTRGEGPWYIMLWEILPNARGPLIVDFCLQDRLHHDPSGNARLLRPRRQPGKPGLGLDDQRGPQAPDDLSAPRLPPALALMSLVLGLNLLADGLREESLKD
jgi:peptide/nickel transport system permease protein